MQFVCEFALENARNSVLELQKCKNFLGEDPQTPLFSQNLVIISMRVPINQKKLYYNYYTYNPAISPPPNVRWFATSLMVVFETDFSFKISFPPPPLLGVINVLSLTIENKSIAITLIRTMYL
jgi:hypothetical protein